MDIPGLEMETPIGFGVTDYVLIAISMVLCVGIGLWAGRPKKGAIQNKEATVNEYLLADRNMSVIPVAFSVMATVLSANAITGSAGEIYMFGAQFLVLIVGYVIGQILVALWIVPILHNIQYVSIYEYVERRYDKALRNVFSFTFLLINLVLNGVFLYAPAISFSTVTGLEYWVSVLVTGTICTFYCILGGMKAVIWVDVLQAVFMFASIIIIIVQGLIDGGGFANVWSLTFDGKSHEHFTFVEDISKRYSFWSIIIFGISVCFYGTVNSQAGAQRLLSVKNSREAQKALVLSVIMMTVFNFLILLLSIVIFAKFTNCNPFQRPESGIFIPDQLFMYAAGKMVAHIPGFLGIAMIGLISASLSTISSFINSFAAITLEDFLKPYFPRLTGSDRRNLVICKILTAFYGVISIVISLAIPHLGGIFRVMMSVIGALMGPFSGILVLAFFFRRANVLACKISLAISVAFCLWVSIGSLINPIEHTTISHKLTDCPASNMSKFWMGYVPPLPQQTTNLTDIPVSTTNFTMPETDKDPYGHIFALYRISFIWYTPIGLAISLLLGIVLSLFFARPEEPDIRLLSSLVMTAEEKEKLAQSNKARFDLINHGIQTIPMSDMHNEKALKV